MNRFIANENIRRFKEQLVNCPDDRQKQTLEQLLIAEQGKLRELMRVRR